VHAKIVHFLSINPGQKQRGNGLCRSERGGEGKREERTTTPPSERGRLNSSVPSATKRKGQDRLHSRAEKEKRKEEKRTYFRKKSISGNALRRMGGKFDCENESA